MIKQTSKPSNSTIFNPQKRFWRALTTYNNPTPLTNRGTVFSNAAETRVEHSCKAVLSCEELLDGEKVV